MSETKVIQFNIKINMVSSIKASVLPMYKENGSLDEGALAEYQEFVINNFAVLDGQEFEDADEETGWKSESTFCITACKKMESTGTDIKCAIFINVANYPLPEGLEKSEIEKLKQGSYKKQIWWVKNVVINGDVFNSYDEALDGLEEKLMQISECE